MSVDGIGGSRPPGFDPGIQDNQPTSEPAPTGYTPPFDDGVDDVSNEPSFLRNDGCPDTGPSAPIIDDAGPTIDDEGPSGPDNTDNEDPIGEGPSGPDDIGEGETPDTSGDDDLQLPDKPPPGGKPPGGNAPILD
jgi:hypothetical protein